VTPFLFAHYLCLEDRAKSYGSWLSFVSQKLTA